MFNFLTTLTRKAMDFIKLARERSAKTNTKVVPNKVPLKNLEAIETPKSLFSLLIDNLTKNTEKFVFNHEQNRESLIKAYAKLSKKDQISLLEKLRAFAEVANFLETSAPSPTKNKPSGRILKKMVPVRQPDKEFYNQREVAAAIGRTEACVSRMVKYNQLKRKPEGVQKKVLEREIQKRKIVYAD